MSRVITFSRTYPAYHPKAGQPTYFVEAILTQLGINYSDHSYFVWLVENNKDITEVFLNEFFNSLSENISPKSHTIRAHKRPLKVGDFMNPKCWAGKPYNKTKEGFWQIKFAPDIQNKKGWSFEIRNDGSYINGKYADLMKLATNDGLLFTDLLAWFKYPKPMNANIICWNDSVIY